MTDIDTKFILERYSDYLNRLIAQNSNEIFSNAGKSHASILMATLFNHTQSEVRMFCEGFKPDLITTFPYINALKNYLEDNGHKLKVLVETDQYKDSASFNLLIEGRRKRGDDSIIYKKITQEKKKKIFETLKSEHCNFSVFDGRMFRLETSPENYQAIGSFNFPERCVKLIELFDDAFECAQDIN